MRILLTILLFATAALAQRPQPPRPAQSPLSFSVSGTTEPEGTGWKHFSIKLPLETSKSCLVWIEDTTNPVGSTYWRVFDPRDVRLVGDRLEFMAVSADRIVYTVGWQK